LLADKPTVATMQGQGFSVQMTPVEATTPGAKAFKAALVAHGVNGPPGYGEQIAWIAAWALKAGLTNVGKANPTSAEFIPAMRSVKDFDANGSLAPKKIDFSAYNVKYFCLWMVKLTGDAFVPYPNSPYCGTASQPDAK
jgi:branched-chain amino acid transport system substrate-binding protein